MRSLGIVVEPPGLELLAGVVDREEQVSVEAFGTDPASAGTVVAVGEGVRELRPGDRVASNGPHAGVVVVPRNLCARVPDSVPFAEASFTVVGAIALQAVRLARADLGSTVFVIGLGLVGQLVVALLRAAGVRVLATDLSAARCELAARMGADVARQGLGAAEIARLTGGIGADAVIIAAATESSGPGRGSRAPERTGCVRRGRGYGFAAKSLLLQGSRVRGVVLLRAWKVRP